MGCTPLVSDEGGLSQPDSLILSSLWSGLKVQPLQKGKGSTKTAKYTKNATPLPQIRMYPDKDNDLLNGQIKPKNARAPRTILPASKMNSPRPRPPHKMDSQNIRLQIRKIAEMRKAFPAMQETFSLVFPAERT